MASYKWFVLICLIGGCTLVLSYSPSIVLDQNVSAFAPANPPSTGAPSESPTLSQSPDEPLCPHGQHWDEAVRYCVIDAPIPPSLESDFSTYEKPVDENLKMRIKYPSNYELQNVDSFEFSSPLENGEKFSSEQGRIIQIDKFTPRGSSGEICSIYSKVCYSSASDYLQQSFNNYTTFANNTTTLVDGPTDFQIGNNPGKKATFRCTGCFALSGFIPNPPSADMNSLQEWIIDKHSGNALLVDITVNEGKYPQFPPSHIVKMLDSLELVPTGSGSPALPP